VEEKLVGADPVVHLTSDWYATLAEAGITSLREKRVYNRGGWVRDWRLVRRGRRVRDWRLVKRTEGAFSEAGTVGFTLTKFGKAELSFVCCTLTLQICIL